MKVSDYFAELFVAGRLADAGWNVYFPHRDQGFDFIITKTIRRHSRGYRCQPARFNNSESMPRGDHLLFFDEAGMSNLESHKFRDMEAAATASS